MKNKTDPDPTLMAETDIKEVYKYIPTQLEKGHEERVNSWMR